MQLDKISVSVRPRNNWEAIDLGFKMAQRWWRPIFLSWAPVFFPFCLILGLIFRDNLAWAILIVWWSKPIFDRIPLHVLSRAVFGDIPDRRETIRAFLKMGISFPFSQLTIYRLSPARSLYLPVWQLENLRGTARTKRSQVLGKQSYSSALSLTLIGLSLEAIILLSIIILGAMLAPQYFANFFDMFTSAMEFVAKFFRSDEPYMKVLYLLYCFTVTFLEPFYVAAGFSLYINRRTILEAWDLELIFRRLAQRLEKMSMIFVFIAVFFIFFNPINVNADVFYTPAHIELEKENSKDKIDAIFKHEKYDQYETLKYRKLFDDNDDTSPIDLPNNPFSLGLSKIVELLLWGIAIIAIVYLIYFLIRNPPDFNKTENKEKPTEIMGLDIESLPENISEEALSLVELGQLREALSLLYRGSLSFVVKNEIAELKDSFTEYDCMQALKSGLPTQTSEYFNSLSKLWIKAAYAHIDPDIFALQQLCLAWPKHFYLENG